MILVTGGAGFIGSHVVDLLLERGHRVRVVDALLPAAHRERPDYLDPAAEWLEGDLRDPAVAERAVSGRDALSRHQAAMVGLGVDLGDLPDYVSHNDLATAAAAARARRGRIRRPARARVEHGRLRRGPLRVRRARRRRPRRRASPRTSTPAASSRPARAAGARSQPRTVPEDAPLDPRSVYAATKLAQEHLCVGLRRARPACPSRRCATTTSTGRGCRATRPYAGVASIFRSAYAAGRVAARVRGRRAAARLRPRARRRARQRARADRARADRRRVQRRQRNAAHGARARPCARRRLRRSSGARRARHGRMARRRRASRRRLSRTRGRAARLPRAGGVRRLGWRSLPQRRCGVSPRDGGDQQAIGAQASQEVLAQKRPLAGGDDHFVAPAASLGVRPARELTTAALAKLQRHGPPW